MKKTKFDEVVKVMARLRAPDGCPWDRKQTHATLLKYLKEEAAEVAQAVRKKDWGNLKEELADILLQILFHAQIAKENKRFDIYDVLGVFKKKYVGRHPHVFGKGKKETLTAAEVKRRWTILKSQEKAF